MEISEKRCWKGYKRVSGKQPYSKGSCVRESYKLFGKVINEARFREYPRAMGETPRDTLTRYIYVGSEGGKTRLGNLIDPRHGREAIVSRDKRGPEGKASHQVPKNVIGDLYTRARNMKANHTSAMLNKRPPDAPYSQHPTEFYRDTVMTTPGFTPATASGSKPLDQAGKDALRARLVGDYRKRHGLRSHISDKNVTGRMLIGNRLAQKQIERNRQKALERQNYSHMKIESYRLVGKVISEEGLHAWFKNSRSTSGKPGWVQVVSGKPCARQAGQKSTPKCVSSSKRASMTPQERKSAQARKRRMDPNQPQKSGAAKPTYVPTDKPKRK